jgi:hypothetical protein
MDEGGDEEEVWMLEVVNGTMERLCTYICLCILHFFIGVVILRILPASYPENSMSHTI